MLILLIIPAAHVRVLTHLLFLFRRWARFGTEEDIHQMDKRTVLQGKVKDFRALFLLGLSTSLISRLSYTEPVFF